MNKARELHAVANGIPVAACNRVGLAPDRSGGELEAEFWGHSTLAGPHGEIIDGPGSEAIVLIATMDLYAALKYAASGRS